MGNSSNHEGGGWLKKLLGGSGGGSVPVSAGAATQMVALLLRAFGENSFDVEETTADETKNSCERWVRHMVDGATPPVPQADRVQKVPGTDWGGMGEYFVGHRRLEKEYVGKSLGDLREAIWNLVQGLSRTFSEDKDSDSRVNQQLDRMKKVVEADSISEIKLVVNHAIQNLQQVLTERERRQRERIAQLGQQLRQMRQELALARQRMAQDPLTQAFNRKAFDEQLARIAALNSLSGQPACLMMIDIDHFKKVNDTYGHPAGDAVLRALADNLNSTFPRRTDFVARYGGEEFAVISENDTLEQAKGMARRMMLRITALRITHGDAEVNLTVSAGLAELIPGEAPADWLARADKALYKAKEEGRNRIEIAS